MQVLRVVFVKMFCKGVSTTSQDDGIGSDSAMLKQLLRGQRDLIGHLSGARELTQNDFKRTKSAIRKALPVSPEGNRDSLASGILPHYSVCIS